MTMSTRIRPPTVLVDLDGVLVRPHPIHNRIANRCTRFVTKFIPGIRDPHKIAELNRVLYTTYGHTVLGMHHCLKCGTAAAAGTAGTVGTAGTAGTVGTAEYADLLRGFNEFVYGMLDDGPTDAMLRNMDSREAREFLSAVPDARVFTNAPTEWVRAVSSITGLDLNPADAGGFLKPDPRAYAAVTSADKGGEVILIDDAMINMLPVMADARWIKVLFCAEPQDAPVRLRHDFYTVSNLQQAAGIVACVRGCAARELTCQTCLAHAPHHAHHWLAEGDPADHVTRAMRATHPNHTRALTAH